MINRIVLLLDGVINFTVDSPRHEVDISNCKAGEFEQGRGLRGVELDLERREELW